MSAWTLEEFARLTAGCKDVREAAAAIGRAVSTACDLAARFEAQGATFAWRVRQGDGRRLPRQSRPRYEPTPGEIAKACLGYLDEHGLGHTHAAQVRCIQVCRGA